MYVQINNSDAGTFFLIDRSCALLITGCGNSPCMLSLAQSGLNCMGVQCGASTLPDRMVLMERTGILYLLRYWLFTLSFRLSLTSFNF